MIRCTFSDTCSPTLVMTPFIFNNSLPICALEGSLELAADELRNALISEVSARLAYDVEELQGLSNEDILHRM